MNEPRPHHICGISELGVAPLTTARRIVSILDPGTAVPPQLAGLHADVLTLYFHDVIAPSSRFRLPERADIERLLEFDRGHLPADTLLIHCTAGISRSTAALAVLLAQRRPGSEAEIFAEIRSLRPMAWPNSLVVELGDSILGARGRLVAELREHYKVQLHSYPEIGKLMIGLRREREIPFDRLTPGDPSRS